MSGARAGGPPAGTRFSSLAALAATAPAWRPWLWLAVRLVLACVFLVAGLTKVGDLDGSVRTVNAYQLLPYEAATVVGSALPFVEIGVGILLLVGVATRIAAAVCAGLLVAFSFGIAAAWARGLSIDCGCFGTGGELAAGASPQYGLDLARDLALLAAAGLLVVQPRTRWAVDGWLAGDPTSLDSDHNDASPEERP